ncbi:ion channel protein [Leifsonia kafniensis]|uniref:Ion channel protein n=1 Tax=Leifsonia kafniensis TaxID=475957 RepID=A0ABP7KZW9_9MICO
MSEIPSPPIGPGTPSGGASNSSTPPIDLGPRTLLVLSLPAIAIGLISAVVLFALDELAHFLQDFLWETVPGWVGVNPDSGWWIFGTLSATGLAVGLIVALVPGHAGRDSATTELIAPPLPLIALPTLALVAVLGLAGGVSLGPENPIIAINTALLVVIVRRIAPRIPSPMVVMLVASGTIGALFGTPVAAALVFTGIVAALKTGGSLFDRLFLPLVSAGAGSITMSMLGSSSATLKLAPLGIPDGFDVGGSIVIAVGATLVGLALAYALPVLHRLFHALGSPIIFTTLGGMILGILGVIGGPITLFKGAQQSEELLANASSYSLGALVLMVVVKILALLIAASSGFRGGRIFPAVFISVDLGLIAHVLLPDVPLGLAIASATLGLVLAVARDGWLALFLAVAIVGDATVLGVLCIAVLPAWLLVSRAPEMIVRPPQPPVNPSAPPATSAAAA